MYYHICRLNLKINQEGLQRGNIETRFVTTSSEYCKAIPVIILDFPRSTVARTGVKTLIFQKYNLYRAETV